MTFLASRCPPRQDVPSVKSVVSIGRGCPASQILCNQEQGWRAGAILFFLQEPEHFKKLEWSRNWHKLVPLQQFLKIL